MIVQSEPEEQVNSQIPEKKFFNVSDFEMENLQRVRFWIKVLGVRFWIEVFPKNQIWRKNDSKRSDSELKKFSKIRFWTRIDI